MGSRGVAALVVLVLAAGACSGTAASSTRADDAEPRRPPPSPSPSVSEHLVARGSGQVISVEPGLVEYWPSTREVRTDGATCNNPDPELAVRETPTTVELIVTIVDVLNDEECLDLLGAVLDAPLGDRELIDGVTGAPIVDVREVSTVAGSTTTLSPVPGEPLNVAVRDEVVDGVCHDDLVVAAADVAVTLIQVPQDAVAGGPPVATGLYEVRSIEGVPATMALAQRPRLRWCEDAPWLVTLPNPAGPWTTALDEGVVCDAVGLERDCHLRSGPD